MSVHHAEELWQAKAACRGPHTALFFPPSHFERKDDKEFREAQAKAICATCPVQAALPGLRPAHPEPHGIWGGYNEVERRDAARAAEQSRCGGGALRLEVSRTVIRSAIL